MSESKEQQKHFYLRNNDALMNSTKLSMKAKQSILLSKAENTVDAYESDWDDFVDWCTYQKVSYSYCHTDPYSLPPEQSEAPYYFP